MAILNYTTTVDPLKTAGEIEYMLVKHGARQVLKDYENEELASISFVIKRGPFDIPIVLTAKVDRCLAVLQREKSTTRNSSIKATRDQAYKVAWRIMRDWIEAQMAIIDIDMVTLEEVFLPYIKTPDGRTFYQQIEDKKFQVSDEY